MTVQIHRSRLCEFTRVWNVNASTINDPSTLQQQQVTWSTSNASAIFIANGIIEFQAETFSKMSLTATVNGNQSLYRLSVRAKLPQHGQAAFQVQLPGLNNLTMTMGSAPADAAKNEIWIRSSQNTSLVAQVPCIAQLADAFHEMDFIWDNQWMRWYVDETLLWEEFIQIKAKQRKDRNAISIRISGARASSKWALERISLDTANASDPFCAPRYSSAINCRAKKPFSPRLGSIRGSLSVTEVEAFINETTAAFPLITKVEELGHSVEKRPLRALCLGACHVPADVKIPQALFTGLHHAREPLSMMNLVYTIDLLTLEYENGDLAALTLLSSRQLWFFLIVNPDGYAQNEKLRVWEHNQMGQRKSAAPTCPQSLVDAGVDLNRNYPVCFARDLNGSSNKPCGDDYNGPFAFSEPETQAVRALVERPTSNFSVAFNYHSYGKVFNLPFACQAMGEPVKPSNAIFIALAQELARFNGFTYGQSWKQSQLYTVNGETSDWMWEKHGIVAMSPEVGPAFNVPTSLGFWPVRDQVPHLAAELYYSNLYLSRMAGPVYSLVVHRLERDSDHRGVLIVTLSIANRGFRRASVELIGSFFLNGTHASDVIRVDLDAAPEGSGMEALMNASVRIPYLDKRDVNKKPQVVFLMVRDGFSCHLVRIAFHVVESSHLFPFQPWQMLPLPRCGTCSTFGTLSLPNNTTKNTSLICSHIEDVSILTSIPTRHIDALESLDELWTEPSRSPRVPSALRSSSNVPLVSFISLASLLVVVCFLGFCFRRWRRQNGTTSASKGRKRGQKYARITEDTTNTLTMEPQNEENEQLNAEKATSSEEKETDESTQRVSPRFRSSSDETIV